MTHTTDLYFEAHVTIDPVLEEDRLSALKRYAEQNDFRVAELLMRKGGQHEDDSFLTARDTNYGDLQLKVIQLVRRLRLEGFVVRRYKIENTLIDSTIEGDLLGVMQ